MYPCRQDIAPPFGFPRLQPFLLSRAMPDKAFSYQQTSFGLLLILPTLTEVYYCVYRFERFSSVKLKHKLRKQLS